MTSAQNLVKHLLLNNLDEIQRKSYLNCHCMGLHSIMLLESPGKTIRLYVAEEGNELWKNTPQNYMDGEELSLGFHAHHCNLTLDVVKGQLRNWVIVKKNDYIRTLGKTQCKSELFEFPTFELPSYSYKSGITNSQMEIISNREVVQFRNHDYTFLEVGQSIRMSAKHIHTVSCSPDEVSAWLVYEGLPDPTYEPIIYSNADIRTPNKMYDSMYQKPSMSQILNLLRKANLYSDIREWI